MLIIISVSHCYAQKVDLIEASKWLNNKLKAAEGAQLKSNFKLSFSKFVNCEYIDTVKSIKLDYPEPKVYYINIYKVNLKKLNPENIKIHIFEGKFYYDIETTNSEQIPVYGYEPNESPQILTYKTSIRIGAFNSTDDDSLEKKVKNLLRNMIIQCGGKKDSF